MSNFGIPRIFDVLFFLKLTYVLLMIELYLMTPFIV